jgi:hypothetical protein
MPVKLLTFWNLHRISILLTLVSASFYWTFAYHLDRADTPKLLSLIIGLTLLLFKLIQFEKFNFRFLLGAGILFRLIFLVSTPNLSPDYFRFIWDGALLLEGQNPYIFTPEQWVNDFGFSFPMSEALYTGMSALSLEHYSNYPPVNQYLFALAVYLGGKTIYGSVIALRFLIIIADLGILYFGRKLLRQLNKAPHHIFWYFLNPMVLIELTGNLHFEGIMVLLLLLGISSILQKRTIGGALFLALSIGIKLMPLMLLPLFIPLMGIRRSLGFFLLIGIVILLSFYPLYSPQALFNYHQTLRLWFSNFEFNAGVYNVAEKVGNWIGIKSWKFIKLYGSISFWTTITACILLALHPKMREPRTWFYGTVGLVSLYFLTSAVVHPWYIVFPLVLSLFTEWRFPIWWSVLVLLSYTAYTEASVVESPFWLAVEYITVIGVMGYEFFKYKDRILVLSKKFNIKSDG